MLNNTADKQIVTQLQNKEPMITLPVGYGMDFFNAILSAHPELMFYVESAQPFINGTTGASRICINMTYWNEDVENSDIRCVSTVDGIVRLMCEYIGNFKKVLGIIVPIGINLTEVFATFRAKYAALYPQYEQVQTSGFQTLGKSFLRLDVKYRIGRVKLALMENDVAKEVDRLCGFLFDASMPAEVKAFIAHNYLATTVKYYYDYDNAGNLLKSYIHSAYGALIKKTCVCQGIAGAFKRLMDKTGVNCDVVFGGLKDRTELHAWNIVKLGDGFCFHVDATWDLASDTPKFEFFGKDDAFMRGSRTWDGKYAAQCKPGKNVYSLARQYVMMHFSRLQARGIPRKFLGV